MRLSREGEKKERQGLAFCGTLVLGQQKGEKTKISRKVHFHKDKIR